MGRILSWLWSFVSIDIAEAPEPPLIEFPSCNDEPPSSPESWEESLSRIGASTPVGIPEETVVEPDEPVLVDVSAVSHPELWETTHVGTQVDERMFSACGWVLYRYEYDHSGD